LGCFPGVKRKELEVNHSPPSVAEVKNASPICLHGVDRDSFTFTFLPRYSINNEKGIQSAAEKTGELSVTN
jgi:hypothetical protein